MKTLKTTIDEIAALAEKMAPEHMTDGRRTKEWLLVNGMKDNLVVNVEWVDSYLTNEGMTTLEKVVHIIQNLMRPAVKELDDIYGDTLQTWPEASGWAMDVERGDGLYRCTESFSTEIRYRSPVTIVWDSGLSYFEKPAVTQNMFLESVGSTYTIPTNELYDCPDTAVSVWMELFSLKSLKDVRVTFPTEISYWGALQVTRSRIAKTYIGLVNKAPLVLEVAAMTARDIRENNYQQEVKVNDSLEYTRLTRKIEGGREASLVEVKSCPDGVWVCKNYVEFDGFLFDYDLSVMVYKELTEGDE